MFKPTGASETLRCTCVIPHSELSALRLVDAYGKADGDPASSQAHSRLDDGTEGIDAATGIIALEGSATYVGPAAAGKYALSNLSR